MIKTEEFELIQRMAKVYATTIYKAYSVDVIITMMLRAHGLGLPVTEAPELFQQLHGKLTLSANAMATLIKRAGYTWVVNRLDDETADLTILDSTGKELGKSIFTIDDATQAGITGKNKNWDNYPRNMLMARALSNAARWYAPDAFGGAPIYTPDELGGEYDTGYTDDTPPAEPDNVVALEIDDNPVPIETADSKAQQDDKPINTKMAQTIAIKFDELCGNKNNGKHYRQYALSEMTGRKITSATKLTVSEGRLALHLLSAEATACKQTGSYDDWSLIRDDVVGDWLGEGGEPRDLWLYVGVSPDPFADAKSFADYIRNWKLDVQWRKTLEGYRNRQKMEAKGA